MIAARRTPRILIIAGSDSGGGAGIQADIKTVTMLGGHAMTAITAVTAQNTMGVEAVHQIPTAIVLAQIEAVVRDIGVDAIKIGMIGNAETAHAVADWLTTHVTQFRSTVTPAKAGVSEFNSGTPDASDPDPHHADVAIVFDPVMVATSGSTLADDATIAVFERLMALATVTTPNLPELEALGGEAAALRHANALLIKGGHAEGPVLTDRLVDRSGELARWQDDRIETPHTHGTGCTLSTAIAVGLAQGMPLPGAIERARQFVRAALLAAPSLGMGHGPMGHQSVQCDFDARSPRA